MRSLPQHAALTRYVLMSRRPLHHINQHIYLRRVHYQGDDIDAIKGSNNTNLAETAFLTDITVNSTNTHAFAILPVTADHLPQLRGHFPNQPVLPGVITLNAMFHLATILRLRSTAGADNMQGRTPHVSHLIRAAFRRVITPDHQSLRVDVRLAEERPDDQAQQSRAPLFRATACLHLEPDAPVTAEAVFTFLRT